MTTGAAAPQGEHGSHGTHGLTGSQYMGATMAGSAWTAAPRNNPLHSRHPATPAVRTVTAVRIRIFFIRRFSVM
jgi:hypothetical protein